MGDGWAMGQFFSKAGIFNPAQLRFMLKVKKKKATWSVMLSNEVELFFLFVFFETGFFCVVLAGLELTKIRLLSLPPKCRD